ncbi:hypothetical protein F5B21DRAFT_217812 [Xylaria acuta]|nr:hypothetical protein F5B21DRAFT_217812 [Xylaria acuta]
MDIIAPSVVLDFPLPPTPISLFVLSFLLVNPHYSCATNSRTASGYSDRATTITGKRAKQLFVLGQTSPWNDFSFPHHAPWQSDPAKSYSR